MNYKLLNSLKKKLKEKKPTIGSWIQSPSLTNAEILAKNGYDWIAIDMEHGQINYSEHENLVRVIEASNCVPLTRVSKSDSDQVKHALDSGSYGVILPMIKNFQKLSSLIESILLPPVGNRSVGFCRANNYGDEVDNYLKKFKRPIIVPMIENVEVFKDLDKISNILHVDALFIGPYDLSSSLKKPGKFNDKSFKALERQFLKMCSKNKMTAGIHVVSNDIKEVKNKIKTGYKFVAFCTDTKFLSYSSKIKNFF